MVDTGATTVAMSQADADRLGLDYSNGRRGMSAAPPTARCRCYRVHARQRALGDVQVYNVEAIVVPARCPTSCSATAS